jgi:ATP-binding cassette subfamily B protein
MPYCFGTLLIFELVFIFHQSQSIVLSLIIVNNQVPYMNRLPKTLSAFLWHFVKQQPIAFAFVMFTAMIWSVNEIIFPYFIKLIVNTIHDFKGDRHAIYAALALPLIALVISWLVNEIAMRSQGIVLITTFPRFRANIRATVFNYVKQHSHEYFSSNFAGSIAKKLAELPNSSQSVLEIICFNFTSITMAFLIALGLMYFTKPLFAAILLVWFCLHMGLTFYFLKLGNQRWATHSAAVSNLSGKIVDSLTNILNVRLFARSSYEAHYLKQFQQDEINKAHKAMWTTELMRFGQGICGVTLIFIIIFTLVHGWIQGWVTLGDFTLIGMLAFWILGMVWYMSYQMTVFVREVGTINEALSLISAGHDITDQPNAQPLQVTQGEIEFNDVTFAYQKNPVVFEQFNVTLKAGQKIGLVGFSGSGKSTFVNLILRFYDLNSGRILIDKQNIAEITQDSLRAQIGMIPQDPTLFHRTLMENIRYGRLEATDEEVYAAAKLAHCQEFIEKLPEGYQALVGERGIKLSGGQRQRIAIARAILKNAPLLILDEATSSLDSVTEKYIQESLQQLMQGRTAIVIAHRLSTLADMDRILVFHKGNIIEDGTKETLLKANGHFAQLWNMQTDGFLPEK